MLQVGIALLPGLLAYAALFGAGILVQCLLAVAFALGMEALMLWLRGQPVRPYLSDGSAVITALLFAACISPFTPWWITFIGIVFAITLAKHAFGGIGHNLFNPAMAGYAFVLLCFPVQMNLWPSSAGGLETVPGSADALTAIFASERADIDAISGATPLNHMKSRLGLMEMVSEIQVEPVYGFFGGRGWEWIALGFLAGGIGLLVLRVIKWHIPVSMLGGLLVTSTVFHLYDSDAYAAPLFHLFSGGTLLGAFFIATDPVTAATSPRGRLVFGTLIGLLTYLIRVWGSFPDGVAFAVLIANGTAPLIDHFTRPRVLGETRDGS